MQSDAGLSYVQATMLRSHLRDLVLHSGLICTCLFSLPT